MPAPTHVFDPPFNIIRCSHAVLDVTDLGQERRLLREHRRPPHRGPRRQDRCICAPAKSTSITRWCCARRRKAACNRLGFKVGNDGDLDKAAAFFSENGISYAFVDQPFQGRTLQFTDPFGFQIELYATMEKRPHLLRRYDLYKGAPSAAARPFQRVRRRGAGHRRFLRGSASASPNMPRRTATMAASPPPGCTARAMSTTSPSPTAVARACITSPIGCRPR